MKIKITAIRKANYTDLQDKYENKIEHTCDIFEGQVFFTDGYTRPDGFCDSAWETIYPFSKRLADGEDDFYDGWMQNKKSAMLNCNDGFRPVSFYIEVVEE